MERGGATLTRRDDKLHQVLRGFQDSCYRERNYRSKANTDRLGRSLALPLPLHLPLPLPVYINDCFLVVVVVVDSGNSSPFPDTSSDDETQLEAQKKVIISPPRTYRIVLLV